MTTLKELQEKFRKRYRPSVIQKVVKVVDEAAYSAANFAVSRWPNGNYAVSQGWVRRQDIFEALKGLGIPGVAAETFNSKGVLLGGDEKVPNVTMLVSGDDTGLMVMRRNERYENYPSLVKQFLALRNFGQDLLSDEWEAFMRSSNLNHVKNVYWLTYDIDPADASGSTVADLRLVIPARDGQAVSGFVARDARAYALSGDLDNVFPVAEEIEQLAKLKPSVDNDKVEPNIYESDDDSNDPRIR